MRFSRTNAVAAAVASVVSGFAVCPQVTSASSLAGSVVVERTGGTAGFGGDAVSTPNTVGIFLDAFSLTPVSPTLLQTITLPTTDPDGAGAQMRITEAGDRDGGPSAQDNARVGHLNLSANGQYLMLGGYSLPVGTVSPQTVNTNGTDPEGPAPRVIARIDTLTGAVDTSTGLDVTNSSNPGSLRSVVSVDGSSFYVQGSSSTIGTRLIPTFGSVTAEVANTTNRINSASHRTLEIAGGRLFMASSSSTVAGVNDFGSTPPTTTTTATPLPGFPAGNTPNFNPGQFVLLDRTAGVGYGGTGIDTIYLANLDQALGGLAKYTFDGANWSLDYTLSAGLSGTNTDTMSIGLIGLDYFADDALGNPIFYATTMGTTTQNALVRITDSGLASSFTKISDSPVNTRFRGVAVVVPEPGSLALLGLGAGGVLVRRRQLPR
jgi:hypothetical protein